MVLILISLFTGLAIFALIKACWTETEPQSSAERQAPPPARPSPPRRNSYSGQRKSESQWVGGKKYPVLNSEGEVYTIDTSLPGSFFFGPQWDKILCAYTEETYLRAKVCFRRRGADNYFAGYQVDIHGIPAFLPRSKCAYFWNEEVDAAGKNLIVKPFAVYPSGAKMGNLLVDALAPIKEVESKRQGNWMIGIYFDSEKFYFAAGKNKTFWCEHRELFSLSRMNPDIRSFEDATGRYYRVEKCGNAAGGRVHPLAIFE